MILQGEEISLTLLFFLLLQINGGFAERKKKLASFSGASNGKVYSMKITDDIHLI